MPAMSDSNAQSVSFKQVAAYDVTPALVGTSLVEPAISEPSICTYPKEYYSLLRASFKAIEALRAGDSEAVKMLTEAQACQVFPQDLRASAQRALKAISG